MKRDFIKKTIAVSLTAMAMLSVTYTKADAEWIKDTEDNWTWNENNYKLVQYIIDDNENLSINKFECEYRAFPREELTNLLISNGCRSVEWKFPEETGFYQPIVIAKK